MYPRQVEIIGAIIVRHEHYSSKDGKTRHGLAPTFEAIQDSKDDDYQERTCGEYEIVLKVIELSRYLWPKHNHARPKGVELVQG